MSPFRDVYWNVPQWARILMYVSQAVGLAFLIARLYQRFRLWLKGRGGQLPFDHFGWRIARVFKHAVLQVRTARDRYAGIMHFLISFPMIALFVGMELPIIDNILYSRILSSRLLQGRFYPIYDSAVDLCSLAALIGILMALFRRNVQRPPQLSGGIRFNLSLSMLLALLVSGFLIQATKLAVAQPPWDIWSFASYSLGQGLLALGLGETALRSIHVVAWVTYFLSVGLLFGAFLDLPIKHLLFAPLNIFFAPFQTRGALAFIDLDKKGVEFGISKIGDFIPAQLMNSAACTECGRCQVACPATIAGTPLDPKQIILDIRTGLRRYGATMLNTPKSSWGDMPIVGALTPEEAIWACTTCWACVDECPVRIDHVGLIVEMRRELMKNEDAIPSSLLSAMRNVENGKDPWGNPKESRMDWARGLNVPLMADKKKADVLYWVGCAGAFDPASRQTARAMVKIFEAANIDYAVLGEEESCTCEWARRAGNEHLFQQMAYSNIALLDEYNFEALVTHCPHCYNTFKNEYPQFGGRYDVIHHSTYIAGLIKNGYLKLGKQKGRKTRARQITYHDPCYLGRYNGVYDDPRNVLKAVRGMNLVEMEHNRNRGLCCGGGGGQMWFETPQERPINKIRVEEALDVDAQLLCTACPFCSIELTSAASKPDLGEKIDIRDIAELVAEMLG
ncbi:MAG: (Fe-S)-binding protein [Anaerolineae bacterium]|nr:(Fe-S)-binding protein [Anaerolineae bacterium]